MQLLISNLMKKNLRNIFNNLLGIRWKWTSRYKNKGYFINHDILKRNS